MSSASMPAHGSRTVYLESRQKRVQVRSESDARFVKLADDFVIKAREVANDPKRKKSPRG